LIFPTKRTGFDLLKDQQFPAVTANGAGQDRKLLLVEGLAVKQ
jgi:hypothetical protein